MIVILIKIVIFSLIFTVHPYIYMAKCDFYSQLMVCFLQPEVAKPLFAEVALNLLLNRATLSPCIVHMLDWFEEDDRLNSQLSEDLFKFIFRETLCESQARRLMYSEPSTVWTEASSTGTSSWTTM